MLIRYVDERVRTLKKDRTAADYQVKQFNEDESAECKQKAESLLYKLREIFGEV